MHYSSLIFLFVFFLPVMVHSNPSDNRKEWHKHIGMNTYFNQNRNLSFDLFCGVKLPRRNPKYETNIGFHYFNNQTTFDSIKNMRFNSFGLFAEGQRMFNSQLFIGLRIGVNFNAVVKASKQQYDLQRTKDPPNLFSGSAFWVQGGYSLQINKHMSIKFLGQIGVHTYKIGTGNVYFSGSSNNFYSPDFIEEQRQQILYNIGIGLNYKI